MTLPRDDGLQLSNGIVGVERLEHPSRLGEMFLVARPVLCTTACSAAPHSTPTYAASAASSSTDFSKVAAVPNQRPFLRHNQTGIPPAHAPPGNKINSRPKLITLSWTPTKLG